MTAAATPPAKKRKQPRRTKHIPQRSCAVCREKKDKRDLTRLVANPEEGVIIDLTGKKNGRGTYLCGRQTCWEKAAATDLLDRALRVEIDSDTKQALWIQYQQNKDIRHA